LINLFGIRGDPWLTLSVRSAVIRGLIRGHAALVDSCVLPDDDGWHGFNELWKIG
jgi:hypothetical protein